MVYDMLVRLVFEKDNIGNPEFIVQNLNAKEKALIIKIVLENGQLIARKIVL